MLDSDLYRKINHCGHLKKQVIDCFGCPKPTEGCQHPPQGISAVLICPMLPIFVFREWQNDKIWK